MARAGTYRIADGRGGGGAGAQRFAPLNSWPDNASLDKARRLLWPIKQKYGRKISWADLMIFTGNCALESMGFQTFGFGFGREDIWEPEEIFWGPEDTWLGDERYSGDRELAEPLGAVQMGLIYVNPEGPNGNPDPLAAAADIRETFARMAMNDEETVALIAGGHTFGKTHGAVDPSIHRPGARGARRSSSRASAGRTAVGSGNGGDALTSGLEGAWTQRARRSGTTASSTTCSSYEWELTKSPAGAKQWTPKNPEAQGTVPDAHDPSKRHAPMMLTTDLALRIDPVYEPIARRFHENPDELADAFAKAWYKLPHRDMGPVSRYLGPWVRRAAAVAGPGPGGRSRADRRGGRSPRSRSKILALGPVGLAAGRHRVGVGGERSAAPTSAAAPTARGFASRRRRIGRSTTRPSWRRCCARSKRIQQRLQRLAAGGKQVSLADLIVLGGCAAVEQAAKDAGHDVTVPFAPGRTDASQEQTDVESFAVLEPTVDGFRNYLHGQSHCRPRTGCSERANMLDADRAGDDGARRRHARAWTPTSGRSQHGVFTDRPETLTQRLLRQPARHGHGVGAVGSAEADVYEGRDRATRRAQVDRRPRVDLVFGSNSQLRALAEVYASDDAQEKFVRDFVAAWDKVMNLDRFDLA